MEGFSKNLTVNEIYNNIMNLIINKKIRNNYQYLSYKNFYLSHQYVSNQIDEVRNNLLKINKPYLYIEPTNLRILHITNFNERHNGRLFLILVEE